MNNPPCSEWKMWLGPEVEGQTDLGTKTLFVRYAPSVEIFGAVEANNVSRVWFCKEFLRGRPMTEIINIFRHLENHVSICVELPLADYAMYATELRPYATFYVKLDLTPNLQEGDHICIGPAYADEAFRIGNGNKVSPSSYLQDEKLS